MTSWSKRHRDPYVRKDGERLAVLRPVDPEVAKHALEQAKALAATGSQDRAAFDAILNDGAQRTYEGFLGKRRRVLDPHDGSDRGPLRPGDSFVRESELVKLAAQASP